MGKYYTKKQLAVRLCILIAIAALIACAVWYTRQRENYPKVFFIEKEHSVYQYTGKAIKPNLRIYTDTDRIHPLSKKYYTVTVENNVNPGSAKITVKGKGLKYGSIKTLTDHFKIIKQKTDDLDEVLYTMAYADNGYSKAERQTRTAQTVIWLSKKRTSQEIKVRTQSFRKSLSDKQASQFYNQWCGFSTYIDSATGPALKSDYYAPKNLRNKSAKAFSSPYFKKNWKTLKKFLPTNVLINSASDLEYADKKTFQAAV